MIQLTDHMRILACHQPVDFRKGIDGLVRLCRDELNEEPFDGIVFLFRNRIQTGIKILVYDGQGFWLCHKRLSQGRLRWWPTDHKEGNLEMEAHLVQVLLRAGNPDVTRAAPSWRPLKDKGLWKRDKTCVPQFPPILKSHDRTDSEIPGKGGLSKRPRVHPVSDSPTPGIQSSKSV